MVIRDSSDFRLTWVAIALAAAVWSGACASSGAVPRPFPVPGSSSHPGAAPARVAPASTVVSEALALRGAPYRNGGSDPTGFDCSGFTQFVFARAGIALPREVRDQFGLGRKVKAREVAPGDLLFFTTVAPGASHVGIAIGGDQFVHAPSSNGVVRVEHLSADYWSHRFIAARRVD